MSVLKKAFIAKLVDFYIKDNFKGNASDLKTNCLGILEVRMSCNKHPGEHFVVFITGHGTLQTSCGTIYFSGNELTIICKANRYKFELLLGLETLPTITSKIHPPSFLLKQEKSKCNQRIRTILCWLILFVQNKRSFLYV